MEEDNNTAIQQSLKEIASLLLLIHEHYLKNVSGVSEILSQLTLLTIDTGNSTVFAHDQ
jgi:hypothetical protein